MRTVIKAENISKQYRLGEIGTGTISHDVNRWWARVRGKEDPFLKIGNANGNLQKKDSNYIWALQKIDFEVKEGEVLGIIGRNGAGKSTLLKLLSKVTKPTTGRILTKGKVASLLEVGTGFHPEMTGRENIFLNGAIMGMTKADIKYKLDEIVDFSGVEKYIDTPVKRYSSGMYVRLGFAVAAHLNAEILIVDEVLAVGDAEFQKKCLGKMGDISKGEGRTILFVSHNMSAVKSLCTAAILLKNGQMLFEGRLPEVITKYLTDSHGQAGEKITDRTDRKGNGLIKVQDIIFRNAENIQVCEIISGQYLKIDFQIETADNICLSNMIVACGFTGGYENNMVDWFSDEMQPDFKSIKNNIFSIEVPALNLRGGIYHLAYQISLDDTNPENFCDVLFYAAKLEIIPSPFFDGRTQTRRGNTFLLKAKFIS